MNPYQILDIPNDATLEEIKQKYKSLAQTHHPDKGGDEEYFKQIKLAYEILSDPDRRKQYDTTGSIDLEMSIRDEALDQLTRVTYEKLTAFNPDTDDLILLIKLEINKWIMNLHNDIRNRKEYITKLDKTLKKLKRKKDGENILKALIEKQIETSNSDIVLAERRLKICGEVLTIVEDYYFSLEDLILLLDKS